MTRIPQSNLGNSPFKRILGHNPSILESWVALENRLLNHSSIGFELMEQVRRVSAQSIGSSYWMAFGDSPGEGRADKRTEAAVSLTKKFIKDHHSITDDDFSVLRSVFSVQEISELCAYIAFIGSANRLGVLVGLTQKDVKLCTYSDVD